MSNEPLFECRDSSTFLIAVMLVAMAGLVSPMFVPNDGRTTELALWGVRAMCLFFAILTLVVMPAVRLRAFPDFIEIRYGFTNLIKFRLAKSKIAKVEAITYNPLLDFGGWGIKGGRGKWSKYTAFTASLTNKALAIETTEKKYLIGCSNPEEAEAFINSILR